MVEITYGHQNTELHISYIQNHTQTHTQVTYIIKIAE